jgi:hypothetical protein
VNIEFGVRLNGTASLGQRRTLIREFKSEAVRMVKERGVPVPENDID